MDKIKPNTLKIKEFDLGSMDFRSKIVIIGKPGSGKSNLIRCICELFGNKYPVAKIFNGTEDTNHFYESTMFPSLFIDSEFTDEKLQDFARRQKLAMRDSETDPDINPNCMLILDDVSDDPKYLRKPIVQSAFKNGRHWRMMLILALQYGMDIPPTIRTNVDYVFIFKEANPKNLKSLFDNYAGIIGDYKSFEDIMNQVTGNYTSLVINNKNQSNNLEDCIFYFKAPLRENKIKLGSEEYHKWSEARYDPKYYLNNI